MTAASSTSAAQGGLGRWLGLEAGVGALAIALSLLTAPELRPALVWGASCALAAGLVALPAVHFGLGQGTSGLLAGFTIGFLARGALVALGLLASGVRGAAALPYVGAFFLLYAFTQGVEIVYVIQRGRTPAANASK